LVVLVSGVIGLFHRTHFRDAMDGGGYEFGIEETEIKRRA
jgi:hypothetical protein